jgi:hypothetical protein
MQYVIILAFVAVAKAAVLGHHGELLAAPAHAHAALVSTGASSQFRSQDVSRQTVFT